jgi:hypothetical protein
MKQTTVHHPIAILPTAFLPTVRPVAQFAVGAMALSLGAAAIAAPAQANPTLPTATVSSVASLEAIAQANPGVDPMLLAQATDLCRRVANPPEGLLIRSQPSPSSGQVGGVGKGSTVTLTTSPATVKSDSTGRKWVEISAPKAGWVSNGYPGQAGHLIMCGTTPPPPPPGSTCRRVINPKEGLLIRRDPTSSAPVVGGLGLYEKMTLTTSPPTSRKGADGRIWVEIAAPTAGWVSNGYGGPANIGPCP